MAQDLHQKIENLINESNLSNHEKQRLIRNLIFDEGAPLCETKTTDSISDISTKNIDGILDQSFRNKFINTGFASLNKEIGGFLPGELVVIGGRPSMGKTQLLLNFVMHISKKHPILYFSYDISKEPLLIIFETSTIL